MRGQLTTERARLDCALRDGAYRCEMLRALAIGVAVAVYGCASTDPPTAAAAFVRASCRIDWRATAHPTDVCFSASFFVVQCSRPVANPADAHCEGPRWDTQRRVGSLWCCSNRSLAGASQPLQDPRECLASHNEKLDTGDSACRATRRWVWRRESER
jgi:hypothetical protein